MVTVCLKRYKSIDFGNLSQDIEYSALVKVKAKAKAITNI